MLRSGRSASLSLSLLLVSCSPPSVSFQAAIHAPSDQEIAKIADFSARSLKAFETKLHPLLTQHCASCHRTGSGFLGSNYPHSDPNSDLAHTTVMGRHYADFVNPSASHLMQVLEPLGPNPHPIPLPDSVIAVAPQFLAAITAWGNLRGLDPQSRPTTTEYELPSLTESPPLTVATVSFADQAVMTFEVTALNGAYRIRNLKIKNPKGASGPSLLIQEISVYLNGQAVMQATGFKLIHATIPSTAPTANPLQISSDQRITGVPQEVILPPVCETIAPTTDQAQCANRVSFGFGVLKYDEAI